MAAFPHKRNTAIIMARWRKLRRASAGGYQLLNETKETKRRTFGNSEWSPAQLTKMADAITSNADATIAAYESWHAAYTATAPIQDD